MKVVALRGPQNMGKSHTLNVAYQFLLRDGYLQVPGHFRSLGNPTQEDILDILEKDGQKIGHCDMGDYQRGSDSLTNLLKYLEDNGCDVAICSCQDKLGIVKAVSSYKNYVFISKTPSKGDFDNRIVNGIDAERLVKAI